MEGLSPLVNCRSMNSCGRRIPDKSGGRRGPRWELLRRKCRPPVGGPAQALFPAGNPFAIRRSGLLANFQPGPLRDVSGPLDWPEQADFGQQPNFAIDSDIGLALCFT